MTGASPAGGLAEASSGFRKVCVVLLSGLGDVIHGLPVVNALKRDASRHITWVVEPMPAPVLRAHPAVDEVVVFHKQRGLRGVAELGGLGDRNFDVTLNLNIYFKSVFPTLLSRAPVRVGFDRRRSRDLTWLFTTHRLPPRPRAHTQDMFLEFLDLLGVEREPVEWRLRPTGPERREQAEFFERFQRPVVAIVPASGVAAKDWIPERWAAVIDAVDSDYGFATMIVGGPSERERRITERILSAAATNPVVALGDGVRALLWRLAGSDLVIAPDTGPVHLARAMGVPVIGLYGHTNPWRVGPYRAYEELWVDAYSEPGEAPDPSRHRPKDGRMEQITVPAVLDRVARAVEGHRSARAPGARASYLPAEPGSGRHHDS
jgi:heptosyltransferase I